MELGRPEFTSYPSLAALSLLTHTYIPHSPLSFSGAGD